MPDPRPSPGSDEPGPRSSSPTVISTAAAAGPPPARLPLGIAGIGLCGVIGFTLARLTLPPEEAAIECVQAALAANGVAADSSLDAEIVLSGKLELVGETRSPRRVSPNAEEGPSAECPIGPGSTCPSPAQRGRGESGTNLGHEVPGGKRAAELAKGPLSDPMRLETIEECRAVYAKLAGLSAALPLLEVETGVASIRVQRSIESRAQPQKVQHPAPDATVSVDNLPEVGACVTSSVGQCELTLRNLAHDARLDVTARLSSGVVVSKATSVLELLQHGLTLQARERSVESAPDCLAAGRSVQDGAQYTKVPADASGHELRAWVEVMSSGIVSDVRPAPGSDSKALAALRLQLAGLRGLPGPCNDLSVSLHY
jgi:hypothetical protein